MTAILEFLRGKKTYIVVFAAIVSAIAGLASEELTLAQFIAAVLAALGVGTLRAGVAKTE